MGYLLGCQAQQGGYGGCRTQRADDRCGVQAVLEEDRIAEIRVVGGHAEPYAYFVADRYCHQEFAPGSAFGFSHRQGGGDDRGRRMEHRRKVGVIEVESMGQGPIDQGRVGGRQAFGFAKDRRLWHSPGLPRHGKGDCARVLAGRRQSVPHQVEHPLRGVLHEVGLQPGRPGGGGESAQCVDEPLSHR
jgi:hypothetical protein